ncbi:SRPBCC domain-containing protein [Polymorphospora rubra]|uniref:SRPBCC domain-containing protein n=1 Tax=Polymorphospora rubra TaxID=338584 RepID=UPI0033E20188
MTNDPIAPDLEVTRVLAASPQQIWSAWADSDAITYWWGPDGFTSTVRELDLRDGGRFDVVMHGPDGSRYENVYLFEDVEVDKRVAYLHQGSKEHGLAPSRSTMIIEEEDADAPRTRVTLRSFYASEADRKRHLEDFQAAAGASQLLERLERVAIQG